MFSQLKTWFAALRQLPDQSLQNHSLSFLREGQWPSLVYAIGDIHGCYELLRQAETEIVERSGEVKGDRLIIVLGDVIDRGAKSAQVIDHLIAAPPAGFRRICLAGNHEIMMLQFLANPNLKSNWLKYGGLQTLASYGISAQELSSKSRIDRDGLKHLLMSYVPDEHVDFMRSLPIGLRLPGATFVHAGIQPAALATNQFDWASFDLRFEALHGLADGDQSLVVHGHHAQKTFELRNNCLNLDTGAYATGQLTVARFTAANAHTIFDVSQKSR